MTSTTLGHLVMGSIRKQGGSSRDVSEYLLLLQKTEVVFPATTWRHTMTQNSSSRSSDAFFLPPWTIGMHVVYMHTCRQNTQRHKINSF